MSIVRLGPDVEIIPQPFGSFVSSRRLKRFDVLNRPATGLLLCLVAGSSTSGLQERGRAAGLGESDVPRLLKSLERKGYLSGSHDSTPASICYASHANVLKATRAEIEVTNRCNLHCEYCYAEVNTSKVELTDDELRALVDGMVAHGLRAVLFSGGEPFLRRGFTEFVEWAAGRLIVEINTNGAFINEERAERLACADLKTVQVSLDSATADYHDSVRGAGSHAKAARALRLLADAGVPAQASCVVTSTNRSMLPDLQAFCEDLGVRLKADPVTRTGFAREISEDRWEREFQATNADRLSASGEDAGMGFEPVCQSQVGYVAISHHGFLKPCNMREGFFDPTGGVLIDTSGWWKGFYGETRLAAIASSAEVPGLEEAADLKSSSSGYLCELQLAAAAAGHLAPISAPVQLTGRRGQAASIR